MAPSAIERRRLDEDGYVTLGDFIAPDLLARLRQRLDHLFVEEGAQAGAEFKQEPGCQRLANLVDKGAVFQEIIALPRLLAYIRHVLGPEIKLSSLNARVCPHGAGAQPLHTDMAALPDAQGFWVCNFVWMLDDFTPSNGTVRLIPGSHRWGQLPQQVLADPLADHPQQVLLTGRAGTVVIMNAHLWHGGTANQTNSPRTALHAFYWRLDKPQQQYQKQLLRPEVQQGLSPEVRYLLALDDPFNDRISGEVAIRSGFLK
jgi:ectoine hydroxylase-related dioxygenase (phytanoyl-CoA dioxygenase family)